MRRLSLTASIFTVLTTSFAAACPLCRDSVISTPADPQATASVGYNGNIGWMLGGLFVVLLVVGKQIVDVVRRANAGSEPDEHGPQAGRLN